MIPARYAASRFPGKLMQKLGDKSVILTTYQATVNTQLFDEVYVVTDSPVIYEEIKSNNGRVIMSSREHDCGTDRIAEAVENMDIDIVVNVQGDEPFTNRESLEKVLEVFSGDDADQIDLASLMSEITHEDEIYNPNTVKVVVDKNNFALYFSRSPIPFQRDQNTFVKCYKHKGIYAFRKQAILDFYRLPAGNIESVEKIECLRFLEYGKKIKMAISNIKSVEIDTPEDLKRANILLDKSTKSINDKFRNFPMVPKVVYGRGSFGQLSSILEEQRKPDAPFVYLIDDVFENNQAFIGRIQLIGKDKIIFISTEHEPKTSDVDAIVNKLRKEFQVLPSGIIGIGGGSVMDLAKAVSILLTNVGSAAEYQGWDLVDNEAVYHVGIPTISGTGAEVSRTCVLIGPEKKLGINSDYTPFDQVILDPDLTIGVPKNQWFYTGMDCYIHCIESLQGTFLNAFSQSYGEKAYDLCKEIFLENNLTAEEMREKLMMASWHGGMSISYSQVGVAHAVSYGLSHVLGIKHGVGNCIVFNHLEEFYPQGVRLFKEMVSYHQIDIPQGVCAGLSEEKMDKMIRISLGMKALWENALGENWQEIMTYDRLKALYQKL